MIPVTLDNAATVGVELRDAKHVQAELAKEFPAADIKIKPAMVKGNRALALHYIDARLVMDRLDAVVGIGGWKDEYTVLDGGNEVECRLSVKIGSEWVCKADVGGQSEQPDEGDRMKAAYSDALKRAAVKFGIGRFLYRMPQQWMDYDPVKKQIIRPTPAQQHGPKPAPPKPAAPPPAAEPPKSGPSLPATGAELHQRLRDKDARLAEQKLCVRGALLQHVTQAGVRAGYAADISAWAGPAIPFAVDAVKEFEAKCRPTPAAKV